MVVRQAEAGDHYYVVDSGQYDVFVQSGMDPPLLVHTYSAASGQPVRRTGLLRAPPSPASSRWPHVAVQLGRMQEDSGSRLKAATDGVAARQASFGELALLYSKPRAATVMARTDGLLYRLHRNAFR